MARTRPLVDCVRLPVTALLVGINPGMRSAAMGHHFAGHSNGFWKLPTPGIDTLRPAEYVAGLGVLRRKVRVWQPALIVFVGVTLYREVREGQKTRPIRIGHQPELFEGVPVYVVPNPSGRNANFTAAEMLKAFKVVARAVRGVRRGSDEGQTVV